MLGLETFSIPPAPLKKGGELNSFPFLRGIEGDLLQLLTTENNS
ncbi:hypothetical protein APA_369 [Pseudanabaena sp. lw0831]|nr:hypothetical protein APA_369 [Pseudanabaena sp. lw0831]